mmetsp:Transcript_54248/g.123645  ORF Transcript_54248/g.123645 Transcript_54248/m.123645 type:complete len:201 (+) Transcript_54248:3479-4081(+)
MAFSLFFRASLGTPFCSASSFAFAVARSSRAFLASSSFRCTSFWTSDFLSSSAASSRALLLFHLVFSFFASSAAFFSTIARALAALSSSFFFSTASLFCRSSSFLSSFLLLDLISDSCLLVFSFFFEADGFSFGLWLPGAPWVFGGGSSAGDSSFFDSFASVDVAFSSLFFKGAECSAEAASFCCFLAASLLWSMTLPLS